MKNNKIKATIYTAILLVGLIAFVAAISGLCMLVVYLEEALPMEVKEKIAAGVIAVFAVGLIWFYVYRLVESKEDENEEMD